MGDLDPIDLRRIAEECEPRTAVTEAKYRSMVERRRAGEPLQYVLGRWGFRHLDLLVDRRVLIPRPETEWVVEEALRRLPDDRPVTVVDLGTGSGAIALSVAVERERARVVGTDSSADALAVARANLAGIGRPATRVELHHGDWWSAVPGELRGEVDLVVSNPPYVSPSDPLPAEVADWEPRDALVPGPTGLEALEAVIAGAPGWLRPGGWLVCEIGETQGDVVRRLAERAGLTEVDVLPDLAERDRVLVAPGVNVDDPRALDAAEWALRSGGAVVLPTDTVYGLAALSTSSELLYALKGRPAEVPVAVLVADLDQASALGVITETATRLARVFWPGPLTIVIDRLEGEGTVAVRCPDHPFLRALAWRVGPIPTTSANRHGEPTPPTADAAAATLSGEVALVIDGGECGGMASTVVDVTADPPVVLREGAVSSAEIMALLT